MKSTDRFSARKLFFHIIYCTSCIFPSRAEWNEPRASYTIANDTYIRDHDYRIGRDSNYNYNLKVKRELSGSDRVYFPGNTNAAPRFQFKPNASNCNGATICNNATDYPKDVILDIIRRQNITPTSISDFLPVEIEDGVINGRIAGDPNVATDLCASSLELLQPNQGETINKEWLYIVNVNTMFNQSITAERCSDENKPCSLIEINGYQTYCVQKFIYRELLALAPDGKRLRTETFRVPASCCCSINLSGNTENRMGIDSKAKENTGK